MALAERGAEGPAPQYRTLDSATPTGRAVIRAIALVAAVTMLPRDARAQTDQRWSVQGSLIWTDLYGSLFETLKAGTGFEAQLRHTSGAWSWGAGVQYTKHGDSEAEADGQDADIKLVGFFLEPRYVLNVGSSRWAPYLSGRGAIARFDVRVNFNTGEVLTFTSNGLTLNGGGGVLVNLTSRVNLDIGATVGYSNYKDTDGMVSGIPYRQEMGSGTNAVARIGLAIGLGK